MIRLVVGLLAATLAWPLMAAALIVRALIAVIRWALLAPIAIALKVLDRLMALAEPRRERREEEA